MKTILNSSEQQHFGTMCGFLHLVVEALSFPSTFAKENVSLKCMHGLDFQSYIVQPARMLCVCFSLELVCAATSFCAKSCSPSCPTNTVDSLREVYFNTAKGLRPRSTPTTARACPTNPKHTLTTAWRSTSRPKLHHSERQGKTSNRTSALSSRHTHAVSQSAACASSICIHQIPGGIIDTGACPQKAARRVGEVPAQVD